ncbi:hypothetical protein [Acaryochloris sp. CCMEE 5410]|uniref:hypothetical protein n=1 Tax=Acaryochloris sp. CCMEE 5410 TaxID=310037 RepID=UPI0002484789|nr:hypothetical protein [Acaryochloris sp. CCMEE 5410]KAI9129908.1 hypothetical protein ON05_030020 [Acaryochloris sp. CCMEE 5410]KAI9130220.1 hypothetical protein ON05_031860 [Acaryochloris sp. CCMEE 5410]
MATDIPKPTEVIQQMIDLRIQLAELEDQIEALKPAFFAACATQGDDKFEQEGAIIARRLTPGKWIYPNHITVQERQLKILKEEFRQTHEPTAGREIIWSIKFL